jgi:hypothetical protein
MTQLLEAPAAPGIDFETFLDDLLIRTRPQPGVKVKLSEAIRLGAARTLPGFALWEKVEPGAIWTCAIGAACYAAAGDRPSNINSLEEAKNYFPDLANEVTVSNELVPEYQTWYPNSIPNGQRFHNWGLGDHIMVLNDTFRLSRERIADIVEALGY